MTDYTPPSNLNVTESPLLLTYLFEKYSDRERLYSQYTLMRPEFNDGFNQVLKLGNLDQNPETAAWRVLDVGCGEGLFSEEIVSRFPHARIVGFDKDREAIATANMAFGSRGDLLFFAHDALVPLSEKILLNTETHYDEGCDIAFAWLVFMHIKDVATALANVAEVIKPGGLIYLRDIPTTYITFPHPSLMALVEIVGEAWKRISAFEFGDRHKEYLEQANFIDVITNRQEYEIGGHTETGQRWLKHTVDSLEAARRGVVDILKLVSGTEFDAHVNSLKQEVTLDMIGRGYGVRTIARKAVEK